MSDYRKKVEISTVGFPFKIKHARISKMKRKLKCASVPCVDTVGHIGAL